MAALAQQRQFQFARRALHAEQQPVVRQPRVVDPILIDNERADQAAELQQRMPIAAVARQA